MERRNAVKKRLGSRENINKSYEVKKLSNTNDKSEGWHGKHYERDNITQASEKFRNKKCLSPSEIVEHRKHESENKNSKHSELDRLANSKELSGGERKNLQIKLHKYIEQTDSHWKEADKRTADAEKIFQKDGDARRKFCSDAGREEHKRWEREMIEKENKEGRKKGVEYDTEAVLRHPDGRKVRLDYVDYENDKITDRKSLSKDENEKKLVDKYEKQRKRHIEAYEHTTGREAREYQYSTYKSPKDVD